MKLKGFIGPAYKLQSLNMNCQRCLNLYPQLDESGTGKNVAALLGTPGLRLFTTLDDTHSVRGWITTSKGRLFAVTFTTLWEISADGTKTSRGTLNSSAGYVGIADNGQQLMLVDGPGGYSRKSIGQQVPCSRQRPELVLEPQRMALLERWRVV